MFAARRVAVTARLLTRSEVQALYDRIGRWQDTQAFYEAPALDALIAHAAFDEASTIFEVGCGTGRGAERILRDHAPPTARYFGVDLSPTMVEIARDRLSAVADRAEVVVDGSLAYEQRSGSQDRVLATYVLDLLSPPDIRALLDEAHRLLAPDGRLCVAGLTWGERPLGRLVAGAWAAIHARRPGWVGGCRPLSVRHFLPAGRWTVLRREVVRAWGVPSEVLVATPV